MGSRPALPWLGIAISVLALGGVIWWATRQPAPSLPRTGTEFAGLFAAIGLYGVNTLLRGERWRLILLRSDAPTRRRDAYGLTTVGYMGNNVLPARAGDIMRIVLMAPRASTSRRNVVGSLLAERVLDIAVLVTLFLVLTSTIATSVGIPAGGSSLWLAGAIGAASIAVAMAWLALRHRALLRRIADFTRPMLRALGDLRGRHGAWMLALTTMIWVVEAGVWWSAALAANLSMSGLEAVYLVALASIFSLIPSGPGYAGTQDAAIVVGTRAIGASGAAALSYLVMVRFVLLVPITVAGLVVLVVGYGGLRRLRRTGGEALAG